MAVYLGVSIDNQALSPNWLQVDACEGFDPVNVYNNTQWWGNMLIEGVYAVNAAAADYGGLGIDAVEENLWGLLTALEAFNAPLEEWYEKRQVLAYNTNSLPFDALTATEASCNLTSNQLYSSWNVMDNFVTQLNNAYNALYNTMAAVQAYEEQEIEEEVLEAVINAQINDNNQAVLDNAEKAQQLNILNTLYSFQTFILPALIIVVGYMLYKRMRR